MSNRICEILGIKKPVIQGPMVWLTDAKLAAAVSEAGIDEESFTLHYQDGSAEAALNEDLSFAHRLGIHSLPTYLIQYKDKAFLMQSFDYQDFAAAITKLTK